jgi:hypothetical protein
VTEGATATLPGRRRGFRLAFGTAAIAKHAWMLVSAAAILGLAAGCGSSGAASMGTTQSGSGSTSVATGATGCFFPEFSLPNDNPNPRGSTPQHALDAFLVRGSVLGAAPPFVSPAKAGYPTTGWREVKAGSHAVTFQSGIAELIFTRVANDSWVITGGHKNC